MIYKRSVLLKYRKFTVSTVSEENHLIRAIEIVTQRLHRVSFMIPTIYSKYNIISTKNDLTRLLKKFDCSIACPKKYNYEQEVDRRIGFQRVKATCSFGLSV